MIPHAIERGDGKPLILLHGVGGGASSWVEQIESLSRGRRVVAWDMPGYGRSAPIAPMTWPGLAAALRDLLDHLRIDRAAVLGHSMGGMVAQEFAATWPERLSGLILSGTSPASDRRAEIGKRPSSPRGSSPSTKASGPRTSPPRWSKPCSATIPTPKA